MSTHRENIALELTYGRLGTVVVAMATVQALVGLIHIVDLARNWSNRRQIQNRASLIPDAQFSAENNLYEDNDNNDMNSPYTSQSNTESETFTRSLTYTEEHITTLQQSVTYRETYSRTLEQRTDYSEKGFRG